jgi:predicted molibdopterin-dependent oxidoreductase YjgC
VRPAAQLRKLAQQETSTLNDGELLLIGGVVTYDDGTLFKLTSQMRSYAFGRNAGINAADAARLGIEDGAPILVENERGSLSLNAKIHEQVLPGTIWIPESLEGAPVGTLLNSSGVTRVSVKVAEAIMVVAA